MRSEWTSPMPQLSVAAAIVTAAVTAVVVAAAAVGADVSDGAVDGCNGNWNTWAATCAGEGADTDGDDGDWNSGATYTVSQKKQDTKLLPITSANVNRFSKFFHWQTHW